MDSQHPVRYIAASLVQFISRRTSKYGSPSLDLCLNPAIAAILGEKPVLAHRFLPNKSDVYVGWGRRSGEQAAHLARSYDKALLRMEDGFLRSYERSDPALSVSIDDVGIYYDATAPSRLEELIKVPLTEQQSDRIGKVLALWRQHGLSKYNAGRDYAAKLPDKYVLVIDQVRNDASITYGMANGETFHTMLNKAIKDNPGLHILVKLHPDIYARAKMGHYDLKELRSMPNVTAIAENCLPTRLIRQAQKVYTVTSQVGFEALIWGRPVCCMGMPFYAGWGLTEDALPPPSRRALVSFEQLAFASLLSYPRYLDCKNYAICDIETIIEQLAERKRTAIS